VLARCYYGTEGSQTIASLVGIQTATVASAQAGAMDNVESDVQIVYYVRNYLHAWRRRSHLRQNLHGCIGKQEKELSDYKLYVAEQYVSKEYMNESERRILDNSRPGPSH
jgi:hypothetical protein